MAWQAAFAIGVLRDIYAFHRYTTHSACLKHTQASPVSYTHLTLPTKLEV